VVRRVFEAFIALLALIVLAPIFVLISFGISVSSPGPIFYRQTRVGLHGKLFRVYKFRSMICNADRVGTSVTTSNDSRITKIGRFLRASKIDEAPQLLNVLLGDMSLVGPRPDVPEIVETYSQDMRQILTVRPGITSNASLMLRNEEALLAHYPDPDHAYLTVFVPLKVSLAMEHVRRRSLWFDLSILLQTIWVLTLGQFARSDHEIILASLDQFSRDSENSS
jgi:lipopolysaccharide/colanic/teichoic acid biosynthesis glycosyltransferase